MNAGALASLISQFAENWAAQQSALSVSLTGYVIELNQDHPLHGELFALCSGRSASLPFIPPSGDILWCTVAPDADSLRQTVAALGAWVLPSFGGTTSGDGFIPPGSAKGVLVPRILAASPDGYYRWRCPRSNFDHVLAKLQLLRSLESVRPTRAQPPRPSLFELRARFASALLIGDRTGAEEIIGQLDLFQLETAVNTQFMRIRVWHHFGEFDRIRNHPDLPLLLAQPLPPRVRTWIGEACGTPSLASPGAPLPPATAPEPPTPPTIALETPPTPPLNTWIDWFGAVKAGRKSEAEAFVQEQRPGDAQDFSATHIEAVCSCLDDFALDDALRSRERAVILAGVGELLDQYIRKPDFPHSNLGTFYLSLLRLWCVLHKGNTAGQEHGHVLLELASALLKLNAHACEVYQTLEEWWEAKPAPSQLYFALDAIELLERERPSTEAPANLWIAAADVIKRTADTLPPVDRNLWRRVGVRLGFDEATIGEYLPPESPDKEPADPLTAAGLRHVAIVCLREQQARLAAQEINQRSGAKVTVVTGTVAGANTAQARTADVVLFVWLATTHAVFRSFDGYDRKKLCYVQGTGTGSIVRSLERWITTSL